MIKLSEILHFNNNNEISTDDLVPINNWSLKHVIYLEDIGFQPNGSYYYSLKNPSITICYKKENGFIIKDDSKKETHTLKDWNDVQNFFDQYNQNWENGPYK